MQSFEEAVQKLIIDYGRNIITKNKALEGYIEDCLGSYQLHKNISLNLAKEGILKSIANTKVLNEIELDNLVKQITDKYGIEKKNVEEVIRKWAKALGVSLNQKSNQRKVVTNNQVHKSFITKFISGDFGLLKTYWLYGFLFSLILLITSYYLADYYHFKDQNIMILFTINSLWYILSFTSIWNATKTYKGSKSMLFVAKVTYRLGFISLIVIWIIILVSI